MILRFFLNVVIATDPLHKFRLQISTEDYNETEENGLTCYLVFTYTEKYPDDGPEVEIEDAVNFEDDYEERLLEHIHEAVGPWICFAHFNLILANLKITENLGIEMIFSLVSSAQEWLNLRWDEFKAGEEDRAQAKLKEFEEAERVRYLTLVAVGHPNNYNSLPIETFRGHTSNRRNVPGMAESVWRGDGHHFAPREGVGKQQQADRTRTIYARHHPQRVRS